MFSFRDGALPAEDGPGVGLVGWTLQHHDEALLTMPRHVLVSAAGVGLYACVLVFVCVCVVLGSVRV